MSSKLSNIKIKHAIVCNFLLHTMACSFVVVRFIIKIIKGYQDPIKNLQGHLGFEQ